MQSQNNSSLPLTVRAQGPSKMSLVVPPIDHLARDGGARNRRVEMSPASFSQRSPLLYNNACSVSLFFPGSPTESGLLSASSPFESSSISTEMGEEKNQRGRWQSDKTRASEETNYPRLPPLRALHEAPSADVNPSLRTDRTAAAGSHQASVPRRSAPPVSPLRLPAPNHVDDIGIAASGTPRTSQGSSILPSQRGISPRKRRISIASLLCSSGCAGSGGVGTSTPSDKSGGDEYVRYQCSPKANKSREENSAPPLKRERLSKGSLEFVMGDIGLAEGSFSCRTCSRTFKRQEDVSAHEEEHKRYKCTFAGCKKRYIRKYSLDTVRLSTSLLSQKGFSSASPHRRDERGCEDMY